MEWGRLADWKVLAMGIEVAVAGACVLLGWQLVHGRQGAQAVSIRGAAASPAPVPGMPGMPSPGQDRGTTVATRPGLADLLRRVNSDDARLYRGQWATIQVLGRATRDYAERHIVPLLLAAARGGRR